MTAIAQCSRCGAGYYQTHGNQKLCSTCRARRTRAYGRVSHGARTCDYCGREFEAFAHHARYCSRRCCDLARRPIDSKYARPEHRRTRRMLTPFAAAGLLRCARGRACRYAELVDGEWVGGIIKPGTPWHVGHPDGESVGGAEHVVCNVSAPMRLRARREGVSRQW